jgi:hypothetical protein
MADEKIKQVKPNQYWTSEDKSQKEQYVNFLAMIAHPTVSLWDWFYQNDAQAPASVKSRIIITPEHAKGCWSNSKDNIINLKTLVHQATEEIPKFPHELSTVGEANAIQVFKKP